LTCLKAYDIMEEKWVTVSSEYLNRKSKYKHWVLGCCVKCRNIQVYRVTDSVVEAKKWWAVEKCDKCGGLCGVCILSKYQKPPGFARKCKKCNFRFTCATIRIKEIPSVLVGLTTVRFESEDVIKEDV